MGCKEILLGCKKIITVSNYISDDFKERYKNYPPQNVVKVPNVCDMELFKKEDRFFKSKFLEKIMSE